MSAALHIRVNPQLELKRHQINDRYFVVVADDFLLNPEEVIAHAQNNRRRFEFPERGYPGELLDVEQPCLTELHQYWRIHMSRVFSFERTEIQDTCQISLTTLQPHKFSWIQRLPHTDYRRDPGKDNYALLVYLFHRQELGGTGFYRFRDEKFWQTVWPRQQQDPDGGLGMVQTRYPMFREAPRYVTGSNEAVELLTCIPARFNRMLCYSGDIPHSAYIEDASLLDDDPTRGRLTLNSFASVWPKHQGA